MTLKRALILAKFFSRLGDGWAWLALAFLFAVLNLPRCAAAEALAVLFAICCFLPAKQAFATTRPPGAAGWSRVAADCYSFPSGHSTTAWSIAIAVAIVWPASAMFLIPLALLISISRVLLRIHFWRDVAAGAGLGTLTGLAAGLITR